MLFSTCDGCCAACHVVRLDSFAEAEEAFGKKTPWDSVYKLELLLRKTSRDPDKINWVLMSINDLRLHKVLIVGASGGKRGKVSQCSYMFQCVQIMGQGAHRSQTNPTRHLDMALLKLDFLHHLLRVQLPRLELPIADESVLRDTLATPETYRLRTGQHTFHAGNILAALDDAHKDMTWFGSLSIAGKAFFRFVEAPCS